MDDSAKVIDFSSAEISWSEFINSRVLHSITSSNTSPRLEFLNHSLLPRIKAGDLSDRLLERLLYFLLLTCARYNDRASRLSILNVFKELNSWNSELFLNKFVPMVTAEVDKFDRKSPDGITYVTSSTIRFVLLTWVNALITFALSSNFAEESSLYWKKLIDSQATLLNSLVHETEKKKSVTKSAITDVRRCIRKNSAHIQSYITYLITGSKSCIPTYRNAILLGVVIDCSLRLKGGSTRTYVENAKDEIIQFYITAIASSKSAVTKTSAGALHDFMKQIVTEEDFRTKLMPTLEKLLLRAPEITLNVLICLVKSLSFDLSIILKKNFLQSLLGHIRSTNKVIQLDAAELLNIMIEKSRDDTVVVDIVKEILQMMSGGKVSNPEHRAIIFHALGYIHQSPGVVKIVIDGLLPIVSKESNETSLSKAISTLKLHTGVLLRAEKDKEVVEKVTDFIVNGLSSAKTGVRKAWAILIGRLVWEEAGSPSASLCNVTQQSLTPLLSTLEKIQANPLNFLGGPIEGYIATAIIEGRAINWKNEEINTLIRSKKHTQNILVNSPKPSFLLWDKIYLKLNTIEEGSWFLRSLEGVVINENVTALKKMDARVFIATAFIYMITSFTLHQTRREAYDTLKNCVQFSPDIVGEFMREGLTNWLLNLEKCTKDSTAVLASTSAHLDPSVNAYLLSKVLTAITTFSKNVEKSVVEDSLVELIVFAHHPAIVSPTKKYNWISLVQRAHLDPGKLVEKYSTRLLEVIRQGETKSRNFYKAAMSAIATVGFISPDTFVPIFLMQCRECLNASLFEKIGAQDIGIWRTEEGTLFVNVLKRNQRNAVEDQNRKGYQTEKWEREVREQIAKKKGNTSAPKLTKDEKTQVDSQLAKESQIRKYVEETRLKLLKGLDIIDSMVDGNAEAVGPHIVEFMRLLHTVVQKGGSLIGEKGVDTYLKISLCTSEKIGNIRMPIGLATLRAMNVQEVPERWLQEKLGHLVSRVLYHLRFITERAMLPTSSFAYCFPLIYQVIQKGGVGLDNEEAGDSEILMEQITLCLDIISFHSALGSSPLIPRTDIIQILQLIIKSYPKLAKTAKTTLTSFGEAIGDTANQEEIDTLFAGLLFAETYVRHACLQALEYIDLLHIDFSRELWISCHDDDENNATLALSLWEDNEMDIDPNYASEILPLLVDGEQYIRSCAAKAIGSAARSLPDSIESTLKMIFDLYKEKAKPIQPEYDEFGIIKPESLKKQDPWEARVGSALALGALAPHMSSSDLKSFFEFLIFEEAVGDIHAQVRQKMLEAGLSAIDIHGGRDVNLLMPVFEGYLDQPAEPTETHDRIRESVVIWFGALSKHLNPTDSRIPVVIEKLLETLKTPSESVQLAVGECLPPLIKLTKDNSPKLIDRLLDQLRNSEKYAERKGAAYGLAGVVKGTGISALKDCNVMSILKESVENKKDYKYRQGALFAFETLSQSLGRLFEPYVIQILPLLLTCFGDSHPDIREATSDAARVIMSKISGHCVKLILPSLLKGLEDRQWRTKKGSVELLGAMAFCAPKQLSISLPAIVPRLTSVLTDSHTNVQAAANQALLHFGEVINNPEIQALVPTLLNALSDPDKNTNTALDSLLETAFVHYIDAPSLALVIPILERGLRERGTEVKKKSSQIVGNMASLTDVKDLAPYLPRLLPCLKEVLVDPVPEARATAAKSLGTMVEKLGEDKFPNLVNELIHTLKSDTSGVDRQGAAQGLSEVLAGLGMERLDGLLPDIITNSTSSKSYVREGFISLLIYLPATFGIRFQPYLGRTIPPILSGLADESEYVRDASLRAGRMIVVNYATKAVDLLLPELERGLFDDNWRIRHSSVQLMGDLLYRIVGISGKTTIEAEDEEETGGTEAGKKALLEVLGKERRDRVLAAIYIVRQDGSGIVRQASIHVWKAIVSNTPRTVKDILHVMMGMIIRNLSSPSYERRQVAARTLGELVRKLGESVLSEIIPILEEGLESVEADMRQGVCIGLREIMGTAGKIQVIDYVDSIIPAIRKALVDESGEVREAAAQAFDTLQQNVGDKAIDEILPTLLNSLQSGDDSAYALEALKEIMAVRANVVFPVLIPNLIAVPISSFNARALASLVTVAGAALNKRLTSILTALMTSLGMESDENTIAELKETERALLLSIDNAEGLQTLMMMLFEAAKSDDSTKRAGACDIVTIFCNETKMDFSRYTSEWVRVLILLLDDRQKDVVISAWNALNAVTKSIKKDELEQFVIPVRRTVKLIGVPGVDLPGFCLPKGIGPILPIFLQGLMYGTPDIRENSALGIGDLIQRTSADALKPFVTQITGPLIRIIGERYPSQVKAAILQTLGLLLTKVPTLLKPFLPQLQRTFIKSLTDPSSTLVRSRAASALGILISLQTRVDPLIAELVTGIKTSEPSIREAMLNALESVVNKAGNNMNEASKKGVLGVIKDGLSDNKEGTVVGASRLLGSLSRHIPPQDIEHIITHHVITGGPSTQSSLLIINAILAENPKVFIDLEITDDIITIIVPSIADTSIIAAGKMLLTEMYHNEQVVSRLVEALVIAIREPATLAGETKRLALTVFRTVGRKYPQILGPHHSAIIPSMILCTNDRNNPVKLAAEQALLYVLQLLDGESIMQKYISTVDTQAAKSVTDIHRRVLSKLVSQEQQRLQQKNNGDETDEEMEEEQEIWAVGSSGTFKSDAEQE
ncbi:17533_t:CDS:10, partial [Acaulospora morrowiae]